MAKPRRVTPKKTALTRFNAPQRRPEPKPVQHRTRQNIETRPPTAAELGQTMAVMSNEPSDDIPLGVLRAALPSRFASADRLAEADDFLFATHA